MADVWDEDIIELCRILMDDDADGALEFLKTYDRQLHFHHLYPRVVEAGAAADGVLRQVLPVASSTRSRSFL